MMSFWPSDQSSLTALCVVFALCAFFGSGKFRLGQLVRYYALESAALMCLFVSMAGHDDEHLYLTAAGVLIFKVTLIPLILSYSAKQSGMSGRLTSYIRPAPSYFVSGLALLSAVFVGMSIAPAIHEADLILIITAFAAMFLGSAMMMVRRDLYSQIIGFLTLENGISLLAAATLGAVPLITEVGIFFAITLGALLMSLLSRRLKELYAVEDTGLVHELAD